MSMTSFSGYQFKVLIDDFQRATQSVQNHCLYLHFTVFGLGPTVNHSMALVTAENTADVRWLHADTGNMALPDVTQHHRLGVVTAEAINSELAILTSSKLPQFHQSNASTCSTTERSMSPV